MSAAMQLEHVPVLGLPVAAALVALWRDCGRRSLAVLTAALATAIAGVVHVLVIPEHYAEASLYGTFFVLLAVAELAWAAAVVLAPTRRLLWAGVAGNAATVALWLFTRLVEVPVGPGAGGTEAFGVLDVLASVAEIGAVVVAVLVMARARDVRVAPHRRRNVTQTA
jgi:hypothetical protein